MKHSTILYSLLIACSSLAEAASISDRSYKSCSNTKLSRKVQKLQDSEGLCDSVVAAPTAKLHEKLADYTNEEVVSACCCILYNCPNTCDAKNRGLDVALYSNPFTFAYPDYPSMKFESFATATPVGVSKANYLGSGNTASIYGLTSPTGSTYALNFRGYFLCPKTQQYDIKVHNADDTVAVWLNEPAICNWDRKTAALFSVWLYPLQTAKFSCKQGQFVPIRIVWANQAGPRGWNFNLYGADGVTYIKDQTATTHLWGRSPHSKTPKFKGKFGAEKNSAGSN
ncbi:hypothetical protein DRE_00133 [Drechslerella stenobrocha 248]|uniref:PA14 domain-containing protein n=1 Tax=Drechslerella stenobrocha 248 TaxID=1043628 RepID=W7I935_9PEZI|nr:hypothetical protein DRE_00133 [Drechslerella stenobrocha 248]